MEKKLDAIYAALDEGNYKNAIKLSQRKEIENHPLVKALRAVAYQRLKMTEEALQLCDEIASERPTHELLLDTLMHIYRPNAEFDRACAVYASAVQQQPANENLSKALFFNYIRAFRYKESQNLSRSMYKQWKKPEYLMWSLVTMVQQGESTNNTVTIDLAEKMMLKVWTDLEYVDAESVRFLLEIMHIQGKYEEQLKFLHGEHAIVSKTFPSPALKKSKPEGSTDVKGGLQALDVLERRAALNVILSHDEEAINVFETILTGHNKDDWVSYESMIELVTKSDKASKSPELITRVENIIGKLKDEVLKSDPKSMPRGPFLAQLLFEAYLINAAPSIIADKYSPILVQHLIEYFDRFGAKLCAFDDMKLALRGFVVLPKASVSTVTDESRLKFIQFLEANIIRDFIVKAPVDIEPSDVVKMRKESQNKLHKLTCAHKLRRYLGIHQSLTVEQLTDTVKEVTDLYLECREFLNQGGDADAREVQHGDDLLLLASEIISNEIVNMKEDHTGSLLEEAIVLLSFGLSKSPYNFQFKLHMIALFKRLHSMSPAAKLFMSLDVKHIQWDTLGYLMLEEAFNLGQFDIAKAVSDGILAFHRSAKSQVPDNLTLAFQFGNYSKCREITAFQDRLKSSQQLGQAKCTAARLSLSVEAKSWKDLKAALPAVTKVIDPTLHFTSSTVAAMRKNQDYTVRRSWDCIPRYPLSIKDMKPWMVVKGGSEGDYHRRRSIEDASIMVDVYLVNALQSVFNEDVDGMLKFSNLLRQSLVDAEFIDVASFSSSSHWTIATDALEFVRLVTIASNSEEAIAVDSLQHVEIVKSIEKLKVDVEMLLSEYHVLATKLADSSRTDESIEAYYISIRNSFSPILDFLNSTAIVLCVILGQAAGGASATSGDAAKKKKKKKAKSKKEGDDAVPSSSGIITAAVKDVIGSLWSGLSAVDIPFKTASSIEMSVNKFETRFLHATHCTLMCTSDEVKESRRRFFDELRKGHLDAIERIRQLIGDRMALLRAFK